MKHPGLVDYAKGQIAKGITPAEVEAHLRKQKWEEEVISSVLREAISDGAALSAAPSPTRSTTTAGGGKSWVLALLLIAAVAIMLTVAYQGFRHIALAREVREKLRFVTVDGKVSARLDIEGSPSPTTHSGETRLFDIFALEGSVDSSSLEDPKAAFVFDFGDGTDAAGALQQFTIETDARFLAAGLLTATLMERFVGGAELRLVDQSIYVRPERIPFFDGFGVEAAALVHALIGPSPLSGAWLRIPAPSQAQAPEDQQKVVSEARLASALVINPLNQLLDNREVLRPLEEADGGEIHGVAVHRRKFAIDGKFLTEKLITALRESALEENMVAVAMLQKASAGKSFADAYSSLDSLQVSDGELELWVGKKDGLPYRALAVLKVREGIETPALLRLRCEITLSYGNPTSIDAPLPSVDWAEMQQNLEPLQAIGEALKEF